ncbi:4943_t:CDS:2 [Dentiscutata erythropus]|uniref:4943_t:CDS:1 n=1 Tax=Dentiscutata erythropus TaxID=1348616 RepID=A0A9N9BTB8_9GLOM|nr:4943_t:CDS:2 [Dentiscutata erythropus]
MTRTGDLAIEGNLSSCDAIKKFRLKPGRSRKKDTSSKIPVNNAGEGISEADLIYHSIFILALFFQVLLVVDALWHRNSVEIVALVIFNLLSLAYAGIQLYQHEILEDQGTQNATYAPINPIFPKDNRNAPKIYYEARMRPIEYTIISLISIFPIYLSFMSYLLTKEFGWVNYKIYSADIRVRDAFWSLTILQTLVKLDIFFIGSYALQLIPSPKIGYYSTVVEIVLVFFFGTLMLVIAWFSVIKEKKYLLLSAINLYAVSLIYWVYRLITVNLPVSDGSVTTFVLVLITVYYSIVCFRNMSRGIYVLAVYRRPEDEAEDFNRNQYSGADDSEAASKRLSKKENAIMQQQLRTQQEHENAILD